MWARQICKFDLNKVAKTIQLRRYEVPVWYRDTLALFDTATAING